MPVYNQDGVGTSQPSPNITRDADGVLRWVYEFSLYRNPTILILVWRIFFFIFLGMYLFLVLLEIGDGFGEALAGLTPVFLGLIGGMFVLSTISYYLYAMVMGGKYCVLFEMDEKGVKHTQMPRQFKKAQILGHLLLLAGAATGNVGAAGQGLLVGSKQSTYSKFKQVKAIKPDRKHQVIKVNSSDLVHNQVYAEAADFDFVLKYIETHVAAAQSKSKSRSQ
ncbi:MAG: hypothetical protein EOM08_08465 [Clostridia bacterium]|nr:hypothetical protein [Clostridia bacterium]NCC76450.1 hypothetical protein [Clostridia bacterium]